MRNLLVLSACSMMLHAAPITVTAISTLSPSPANPVTVGTVTYQQRTLALQSVVAGGRTWLPQLALRPDEFIIRRNNIGGPYDNREVVWEQQFSGQNNVQGPVPSDTASVLSMNNLYVGSDNVFSNTGDGSGNNTTNERIDFLYSSPVAVRPGLAALIMERGLATIHDGFQIAAVLERDLSTGAPTRYSPRVAVARGWGQANLGQINTTVLRTSNPATAPPFSASANVTGQQLGGMLVPLTDFAGGATVIYGYSIFAADVTGTAEDLVDWRNAAFYPTNTNADGGLDMVAANVGLLSEVPEPATWLLAGLALFFLGVLKRRE